MQQRQTPSASVPFIPGLGLGLGPTKKSVTLMEGGELDNAVAQRELSVSYGVSARLLVCRYASGVVRGEDTRSKGQPWDSMDQAALDDNGVLVSGSEILLDGICQRREGQGGGGPVPAGPHVYGR